MTVEWLDVEGSFSMLFSEEGKGNFISNEGTDSFSWLGSGPYTIILDNQFLTVNLSESSITWSSSEDVCIQFSLTK